MNFLISNIRFLYAFKFLLVISLQLLFIDILNPGGAPGYNTRFLALNIFLIILVSFECFFSFDQLRGNKGKNKFVKKETCLFIFIVVVSFFYFLFNSQIINIWHDEMSQFSSAFKSPLYMASVRHQPSLSLYQSALATFLFEDNRMQVRFFTFLNSSIFSFLIYSFVRKITGSFICSVLSLFFCFTCFGVLYHTVDARPTSLGFVYLLLIFDFIYFRFRPNHWRSYFSLASLVTLFLHSVGFQPVIFINVFIFTLMFFSSPLSKWTHKVYVFLVSAALPLIFFYPYQKYIIDNSEGRIKGVGFFETLKSNLVQFHWLDFEKVQNFNINGYLYLVIMFLTISFIFLKRKVSDFDRNVFNVAMQFFLATFLYIFLAHNFYVINIDHWFRHRYVSFYYITLIITLVTLIYLTFKWVYSTNAKSFFISLFLLFLLISPLKLTSYNHLKQSKNDYFFDGINQFRALEIIAENKRPEVICLEATNNFLLRHCFGIKHLNDHNGQLNRFMGNKYSTYNMYPSYKGVWFKSFEMINNNGFIFIFIHDYKTIISLQQKLTGFKTDIREGALYISVGPSDVNKEKYLEIIKQVKDLLSRHGKLHARKDIEVYLTTISTD